MAEREGSVCVCVCYYVTTSGITLLSASFSDKPVSQTHPLRGPPGTTAGCGTIMGGEKEMGMLLRGGGDAPQQDESGYGAEACTEIWSNNDHMCPSVLTDERDERRALVFGYILLDLDFALLRHFQLSLL